MTWIVQNQSIPVSIDGTLPDNIRSEVMIVKSETLEDFLRLLQCHIKLNELETRKVWSDHAFLIYENELNKFLPKYIKDTIYGQITLIFSETEYVVVKKVKKND